MSDGMRSLLYSLYFMIEQGRRRRLRAPPSLPAKTQRNKERNQNMGIIKATMGAVGGGLADQWLEVLEAKDMGSDTLFTKGVKVRANDKRNGNKKGTEDYITNGSIIHVYPNQFMMLVDGGKIVDFTAEEGYYKVDNAAAPSLFSGGFGASLKESFSRVKFGGVPGTAQKA